MPRHLRRLAPSLAVALAAFAVVRVARADWPMARHDAARTALADGKSDIRDPAVYWSYYLGGAIRRDALFPYNIDPDGQSEFIYAAGGVVAAKRADDTLIWRTRTYGESYLLGLADLDSDGKDEIIVSTARRVFVLDPITGQIRWSQHEGEMGQIGYVRVGHVKAGPAPDLVITECGGCGASKLQTGFIYSFAKGFADPIRLPLPSLQGVNSGLSIPNTDGKGPAEILLNATSATFALVDGETGKVLATSPSIGDTMTWWASCVPGDIDGLPGEEIVCVSAPDAEPVPTSPDLRKVFALKFRPGPPAALDLLWVYTVPPDQGLSSAYNDPLIQLQEGGPYEVVVTGRRADGSYATHILVASTGVEVASLEGHRYLGSARLDGPADPARQTLLTLAGTTLSAWSFDASTSALKPRWSLVDRAPLTSPRWSRVPISSATPTEIMTLQPDKKGPVLLVTGKFGSSAELDLFATSGADAAPTLTAALPFVDASSLPSIWSVAGSDLAFGGNDGVLRLLDAHLEEKPGAIRFGGYYAAGGWVQLGLSPVVAPISGGEAPILVRDSRGSLLRLDAAFAGPSKPPVKTWEAELTSAPILVPGLAGGAAGVAAIAVLKGTIPPAYSVRALRIEDGTVVWEAPLGARPLNDLVSGNFDGDGIPDLALQSTHPGDNHVATRALAGADGAELWSFHANPGLCGLQPAGFSVRDWDGDGFDDVLQQAYYTRADSGQTGTPLIISETASCYFMPTLFDLDGDGVEEVILNGGMGSITVLTHDLQKQLLLSTEDDRPYPYAAIARCDTGPVVLQASWSIPARLKITQLGANNFGASSGIVLADGAKYPDQATAEAAGAGSGQLTSPTVHPDLAGDGRPAAVIGSTDGWLYIVDPCSGDLKAALDFEFEVGEPIFADTDGDGLDEILVSVADGNLYNVRNAIPSPSTGASGSGSGSGSSGGGGTGTGTGTGTGGEGGEGGEGPGGHPRSPWISLYGRGGCYCQAPALGGEASGAWVLLVFGIGAILRLRLRRS